MKQTTLILVRHAQTQAEGDNGSGRLCGWYNAPLSELGRAQVECLQSRLTTEPPLAAVYTSPLGRARETAVAAEGQPRPRVLRSLREINCGMVDGWPLNEVQARYPELWERNLAQADECLAWPGGETYREFRIRCVRAVRMIAARHSGQRVLVVTHTGVITQVLGMLEGLSPARWGAFRPGTASITELRWECQFGELITFDDRSHLRPVHDAAA